MHQSLINSSNHHKCVVDRYEKSITQIQEELTQTKAKLIRVEKDRAFERNDLIECDSANLDTEVDRLVSLSS